MAAASGKGRQARQGNQIDREQGRVMGKRLAVESFLTTVRDEAKAVDDCMRDDLAALAGEADPLLMEVLDYGLFNGGKRLRPLLVVLAVRLCGGPRDLTTLRLGCAFEYLHAATLFHDDIIDNSATRRGRPSVGSRYGTVAAILAGDFLHAWSMATVGEIAGRQGLALFSRATTGMVAGEFLQLRHSERVSLAESDYFRAIMGKTGLLIAAACEVGATFAGGSVESVRALREYGEQLGCAFQIVDDLLDYLGDGEKTGKRVGNDLAEGKLTLPLILALEQMAAAERGRLQTILADRQVRAASLSEVTTLVDGAGGFILARQRAEKAVAAAIAALGRVPGSGESSEGRLLADLARYTLVRDK